MEEECAKTEFRSNMSSFEEMFEFLESSEQARKLLLNAMQWPISSFSLNRIVDAEREEEQKPISLRLKLPNLRLS